MRSPRRLRAFSLIEIAVVMAILGLLLLLGALRMDSLTPERTLDSAARVMRATLEEMRNAAMLRGEPATLVYDLSQGTCRIEFAADATAGEPLLETRLPEGIAFRALRRRGAPEQREGETRLRMTSGGACPPHTLVLALTTGGMAVRMLRVDPLTGSVDVSAEEKAFDEAFTFMSDEREPVQP